MTQLPLPLVCVVTDRRAARGPLVDTVVRAVDGGVNLVQVREKDLGAAELLSLVRNLQAALERRAMVLVNDRADVALAAGADGVHLPARGLAIPAARGLVGNALVGRSTHAPDEAASAARQGADYVLLGTVFPSRSHPAGPTGGLELVRQARPLCPVPLIGIGGITPANAGSVIEAGADGVAVISAVLAAVDPRNAAAQLWQAVCDAWRKREAA